MYALIRHVLQHWPSKSIYKTRDHERFFNFFSSTYSDTFEDNGYVIANQGSFLSVCFDVASVDQSSKISNQGSLFQIYFKYSNTGKAERTFSLSWNRPTNDKYNKKAKKLCIATLIIDNASLKCLQVHFYFLLGP